MSNTETSETMNPTQKRLLAEAVEVPERLQNSFGGGVSAAFPLFSQWGNTYWAALIINGMWINVPYTIVITAHSADLEDKSPLISLEIIWDIPVLYDSDAIPRQIKNRLDGACYKALSSLASQSSGATVKQGDRTHSIEFGSRWFDKYQKANDMTIILEDYVQKIRTDVRMKWQKVINDIENT